MASKKSRVSALLATGIGAARRATVKAFSAFNGYGDGGYGTQPYGV